MYRLLRCIIAIIVALSVCIANVQAESAAGIDVTGPVIGIDLGTTYSCVAVHKDGEIKIIHNEQGIRQIPNYVAFTESGQILIGDAAKNQAAINPHNTIYDVKRLLGRQFNDSMLQNDIKMLPYTVIDQHNEPFIQVNVAGSTQVYAAEEISAMIIGYMKEIAEAYLREPVHNAVITVPRYFNAAQRQATQDAGWMAGLNVFEMVDEPTAVTLAYAGEYDVKWNTEIRSQIVVHIGGSTFEVTVCGLWQGYCAHPVSYVDTHLGGYDFNQHVVSYFVQLIHEQYSVDLTDRSRGMAQLRDAVEQAKRALSTVEQVKVEIEGLVDGQNFSETLARSKFEELNVDLFDKISVSVAAVLHDSNLTINDIHEIVLVGGSTKIPRISEMLERYSNVTESFNQATHGDEVVAYGAALLGYRLFQHGHNPCIYDDTLCVAWQPLSIGIETVGGVFTTVSEGDRPVPSRHSHIVTTYHDNQSAVLIQVFQGERSMTRDNMLLGTLQFNGLPPAPRGVPQIEVTFEIDCSDELVVQATDQGTGTTNKLTIPGKQWRWIPNTVIGRMRCEAKKFAYSDRLIKQQIQSTIPVQLRHSIDGTTHIQGIGTPVSADNDKIQHTHNDL